jgi:hypothetical protein
MSPHPTLLPCPTGQPPLKVIGAARAPGAANVISPSEGVHAVSAQHCGFGRGVASGPQVSVALPALRPVALPNVLRLLWRIVLRGSGLKPCKIKTVAVLRFLREGGSGPPKPGPQRSAHFLDTGGRGACGIAIALTN